MALQWRKIFGLQGDVFDSYEASHQEQHTGQAVSNEDVVQNRGNGCLDSSQQVQAQEDHTAAKHLSLQVCPLFTVTFCLTVAKRSPVPHI